MYAALLSVSPVECVYVRSSASTLPSAASSPATVAEAHNFSAVLTASADLSAAMAKPATANRIVNTLIRVSLLLRTLVRSSIAENGLFGEEGRRSPPKSGVAPALRIEIPRGDLRLDQLLPAVLVGQSRENTSITMLATGRAMRSRWIFMIASSSDRRDYTRQYCQTRPSRYRIVLGNRGHRA